MAKEMVGQVLDGEILPPGRRTRRANNDAADAEHVRKQADLYKDRIVSLRRAPAAISTREAKAAGRTISTNEQAQAVGPGEYSVKDMPGLTLQVNENGAGSYFWRYRLAGRRRMMGLGPRKTVTLARAIVAAKDADTLRRKNIDPIDDRVRERAAIAAEVRAAKPVVFQKAAETYVDERVRHWRHKYARACWLAPVARYAFPKLGQVNADAVSIADVTAAIKSAEAAGAFKTGPRRQSSSGSRPRPRPARRCRRGCS